MKHTHFCEWRQSCVKPELITANVSSLAGEAVLECLVGDKLAGFGGWSQQYVTGAVSHVLRRYEQSVNGGWWVSGLDPLNDWAPLDWGQFKADTPDLDHKGKAKKYSSPEGQKPRALFLKVSWRVGLKIATRHGYGQAYRQRMRTALGDTRSLLSAVKAMDEGFWAWWCAMPEAPILITEGAKKAGCALSAGYAAIALVGVNAGYRVKDALGHPCPPELVEDVKVIATPGRPVYLAFDQDTKATAKRRVTGALFRFGGLLAAAGYVVQMVEWSAAQGKGLDDLVANVGTAALHQAIDRALTLDEWRLKVALDSALGTLLPSMQVNTRDLDTLDAASLPQTGIIALRSAKGTGKTNLIADLVADGDTTLALGHRIVLMRNLCRRLGVNYRGDLDRLKGEFINGDGYTLRIGGCVDGTLLAIDLEKFRGCDLILDEFVQLMRHLLTSSTCNKEGARPVLLARFTQLVQAAKRVIVADADLDKPCLDYLAHLRGEGTPLWLLVNEAKVDPWPVTFIEAPDASAITARLLEAVQAGQRVFIATDSKAGSKRLDRLITDLEAARLKVLLLNSDTSSGELEKAVIMDPNTTITDYPVVIATPSMGTGVSIEVEHFDQVYGLFWGASSTDADMSQALARVRQPVPRVVWCAKGGRNFSKVGRETNPLRLKKLLQDKATATAQMTAASLGALTTHITDYDWLNPHVHLWATLEAQRNRSMLSLRSALKVRLIHEGHHLTIERLDTHQEVKRQMAEARLQIKASEARATASAVNLTATQAKALETAEHLDTEERLALQKWHLAEFYAIPLEAVTAELVLLDNHGRYRGQLLELEAFLYPETASAAVVRSVERQAQHHLTLCPWDISTAELRRQVRVRLGLEEWIHNPNEWLSDDDTLAQFAAQALTLAPQVKAALNVALKPAMRPQQILGQLLDQMGLPTTSRQTRQGHPKRIRIYQIDPDAKAQALAILARRAERRNGSDHQASTSDTPPMVNDHTWRGCDTLNLPKTDDSWVGQHVRWGSSLGLWRVLDTEGGSATIQLQNPVVQTVRTVPLADLIALELAG
ncbi:hypothetical protein GFS31_43360 (plasmid) [Leptolyngbya sp. BL0902]|uniref:plasmid replication protein, CyRepA1 family n=1 Tax=Leptolyngbya sp. BL0902 TaxID=1115757 RepID=UPI0018E7EB2D|nr:plasmid replication protein, CyRepA1 family [Leptolyngbya sp. BL0902]QQE67623.1 hypothetical protein GFS31_43360 [Leptolyngbya sp. BL0902]